MIDANCYEPVAHVLCYFYLNGFPILRDPLQVHLSCICIVRRRIDFMLKGVFAALMWVLSLYVQGIELGFVVYVLIFRILGCYYIKIYTYADTERFDLSPFG